MLAFFAAFVIVLILRPTEVETMSAEGYISLDHWLPDWYEEPDIDYVLHQRLLHIRQRCLSGFTGKRNAWKEEPALVIARSKQIEYCSTAKAGSTFWKNVLGRIRGEEFHSGEKRHVKMVGDAENSSTIDFFSQNHNCNNLLLLPSAI